MPNEFTVNTKQLADFLQGVSTDTSFLINRMVQSFSDQIFDVGHELAAFDRSINDRNDPIIEDARALVSELDDKFTSYVKGQISSAFEMLSTRGIAQAAKSSGVAKANRMFTSKGSFGDSAIGASQCSDGRIADCNTDGTLDDPGSNCAPESWLNDGYCDGADRPYGVDLSCYETDEECTPPFVCPAGFRENPAFGEFGEQAADPTDDSGNIGPTGTPSPFDTDIRGNVRCIPIVDEPDQCCPTVELDCPEDKFVAIYKEGQECQVVEIGEDIPEGWQPVGTDLTRAGALAKGAAYCVGISSTAATKPKWTVSSKGELLCDNDSYLDTPSILKDLGIQPSDILADIMSGGSVTDGTWSPTVNVENPIGKMISSGVGSLLSGIASGASDHILEFIKTSGCTDSIAAGLPLTRVVAGAFAQYISPELNYYVTPLRYATQRACPLYFPSADQAINCYLTDDINQETFESWVNLNGFCTDPMTTLANSRRSKPDANQLTRMRWREQITAEQWLKGMRQIGYTVEDEADQIYQQSFQLPPVSELIRYMVRDTADKDIVELNQADDGFGKKFIGQIKQWASATGIPEDVFVHSWRAHWRLPSAGQLYTMFHRLNFDDTPANLKSDLGFVRKMLKADDMAPGMVDRMLAINEKILGLRDIRRAYQVGAIKKDEVPRYFMALGYNAQNAKTLTDFNTLLRKKSLPRNINIRLWKKEVIDKEAVRERLIEDRFDPNDIDDQLEDTAKEFGNSKPVKLFAKGLMTRREAEGRLQDLGVPNETSNQWFEDAGRAFLKHPTVKDFLHGTASRAEVDAVFGDAGLPNSIRVEIDTRITNKFKSKTRKACARALRKRFLKGEFNNQQVRLELQKVGFDALRANELIEGWDCERAANGKTIPLTTLCRWLEMGIINPNQFVQRLQNLGYDRDDAFNSLRDCTIRLGIKEQKRLLKIANDDARETEKAIRETNRLAKQTEAQRKKMARCREAARKTTERREAAMLKAADKLAKKADLDLPVAVSQIRQAIRAAQIEFATSRDKVILAVRQAVDQWQGEDEETFNVRVWEVIQAMQDLDNGYAEPDPAKCEAS